MLGDLLQEQVGIVAGEIARQRRERRRAARGQRVEHLGAQRAGLPVVEDAELRRHPGLEREAAQQRLAEGVDRLDLQPAGRLQRAGEEGAGAVEPVGRQRLGRARRAPSSAARSAASSSIAQAPRVRNSRFCISAAAALV